MRVPLWIAVGVLGAGLASLYAKTPAAPEVTQLRENVELGQQLATRARQAHDDLKLSCVDAQLDIERSALTAAQRDLASNHSQRIAALSAESDRASRAAMACWGAQQLAGATPTTGSAPAPTTGSTPSASGSATPAAGSAAGSAAPTTGSAAPVTGSGSGTPDSTGSASGSDSATTGSASGSAANTGSATGAGSAAPSRAIKPPAKPGLSDSFIESLRQAHPADNPTNDCNVLGLANCQSLPLEYVAWASPFSPS
jgi:hypothetical protein